MEFSGPVTTVFAILLPRLQFEISLPLAVAFLVVCAGAWIAIVIDMRRRPTAESVPHSRTSKHASRSLDEREVTQRIG